VSAVFAGRAVPRFGRWLTATGLLATAGGMVATALVLRTVGGSTAAWAAAAPLMVAGIGGGMVIAPNTSLTLESVPAQMAGAAGGALQTAQRIGAAIGTALLATVYYRALTGSGGDYASAVSDTLFCAAGLMLLALLIAVGDLIERRRSDRLSAAGKSGAARDPRTAGTTRHEAVTP
jgi:MFS family permease